jgi:hypothetical protein
MQITARSGLLWSAYIRVQGMRILRLTLAVIEQTGHTRRPCWQTRFRQPGTLVVEEAMFCGDTRHAHSAADAGRAKANSARFLSQTNDMRHLQLYTMHLPALPNLEASEKEFN